jgi:hypothetical protein
MMLTKTCQVDNNLKWSCGGLVRSNYNMLYRNVTFQLNHICEFSRLYPFAMSVLPLTRFEYLITFMLLFI